MQFEKLKLLYCLLKKVIIVVKYLDFTDIILKQLVIKSSKSLYINKYSINPEIDKQLPNKLIYSLEYVKLKILKTYIKTYLVNNFIRSSNFSAKALILFFKKSNNKLYIFVYYQNLNNLIIKNKYLLLLIIKLLN